MDVGSPAVRLEHTPLIVSVCWASLARAPFVPKGALWVLRLLLFRS